MAYQYIYGAGQQIGTGLEGSDNPNVSAVGTTVKGAVDPAQALSQSVSRGDKWWESAIAGTGLGAGIIAARQNKENIALEDARQRDFLNEINAKREALRKGLDYSYQLAQTRARQNLGQTQQNILRGSRDVGSAQQGLNIAQQNYGNQMNQAAVPLLAQQNSLLGMAGQQIDKLATRKMNIEMWKEITRQTKAAEQQKAAQANAMGALAMVLGNMGNKNASANTQQVPVQSANTSVAATQTAPDYSGTPLLNRNSGIPFNTQFNNYIPAQNNNYANTVGGSMNYSTQNGQIGQSQPFDSSFLYNQQSPYLTPQANSNYTPYSRLSDEKTMSDIMRNEKLGDWSGSNPYIY